MEESIRNHRQSAKRALLVVFGDLTIGNKKLGADFIFQQLSSQKLWFVARVPKAMELGCSVILYQVAVGFRGTAILEKVQPSLGSKAATSQDILAQLYPWKLIFSKFHEFAMPISPMPLVERLSFVTNKKHWGHSIRFTPRLIPHDDYALIVAAQIKAPRSKQRV